MSRVAPGETTKLLGVLISFDVRAAILPAATGDFHRIASVREPL